MDTCFDSLHPGLSATKRKASFPAPPWRQNPKHSSAPIARLNLPELRISERTSTLPTALLRDDVARIILNALTHQQRFTLNGFLSRQFPYYWGLQRKLTQSSEKTIEFATFASALDGALKQFLADLVFSNRAPTLRIFDGAANFSPDLRKTLNSYLGFSMPDVGFRLFYCELRRYLERVGNPIEGFPGRAKLMSDGSIVMVRREKAAKTE